MRARLLIITLLFGATSFGAEENWPQWRGPHLNGVSKTATPPTTWSTTENVLWKLPLPSWGAATPIVWGDRVFVTSPTKPPTTDAKPDVSRRFFRDAGKGHPGGAELQLYCVSREDGSVLWKGDLGKGNTLFGKQNMASPSPVTDGTHVWALTGAGVLTAFDMNGHRKWRVDLREAYGEFGLYWGYASSPLLHDGKVIVEVLHGATTSNPSYIVAFDGKTGKVVWKVERKSDATKECPDAYTTPTVLAHNGTERIIVTGADYVTAHDPKTGAEIWRAAGLNPDKRGNYRICASPVAIDGLVYAPTRIWPFIVLRAGGKGDVTTSHLAWKFEGKGAPDVPTPVCDGKYLYLVNDKGIAACLDAKSGSTVWGPERTQIGTVSASPVLAGGKLYITNEQATTTVLAAGPEFKILATNKLDDDYTLASPAPAGSQLFIRTSEFLYCVAQPPPQS